MRVLRIEKIKDLIRQVRGYEKIYIYGAKTIAQRCCLYLEYHGIKVTAFLVSSRYKNPDVLENHSVLRIEDYETKKFDIIINAVSEKFLDDVTEELRKYSVSFILEISSKICDRFPVKAIRAGRCKISDEAKIGKRTEIFADETSEIIIGPGVKIGSQTVILAADHSYIHIGAGSIVHKKSRMLLSGNSVLLIGMDSQFGSKVSITLSDDSMLHLDECSLIRKASKINAAGHSKIETGWKTEFGEKSALDVMDESVLQIGNRCRFRDYFNISSTKKSKTIFEDGNFWGEFSRFLIGPEGDVRLGKQVHDMGNILLACQQGGKLSIGEGATIGNFAHFGTQGGEIRIGKDNMFSFFVKMSTSAHSIIDEATGEVITNQKPIITGDHVWVGMGATLVAGCHMHENSIIGAEAVVTKEFPAHCSVAGVPAQIVKQGVSWSREHL